MSHLVYYNMGTDRSSRHPPTKAHEDQLFYEIHQLVHESLQ